MIRKVIKYLVNEDYRFVINAYKGKYDYLEDEKYLKRLFRGSMGYELNLNNPITFNEKIQWLKIYDRKPEYTKMVDKILAKEYVARIIGDEYIVPTLGIWDSFDEIDFSKLPDSFVLKCSHDSGGVSICRNKAKYNIKEAKSVITKSLQRNFYCALREWPYKNVQPRIMAEAYLENKSDPSKGLVDYKFFCFGGVPKFLYISQGLENHKTAKISFYDLEGKVLDFKRSDYLPIGAIVLPNNYLEMVGLATELSSSIDSPFVRIDLYSINGNTYFSEITFSPCGGFLPFSPESADKVVGDMLLLNLDK